MVLEPPLTSSKVLQSVLVVDGIRRIGLGKLQDCGEVLGEMCNDGVGDLGNMEESVTELLVASAVPTRVAYIKSMDQ